MRILLAMALSAAFYFLAPSGWSQESGVVISFETGEPETNLDADQLRELGELGLSNDDLFGIAEIARDYQSLRDEGLGVELNIAGGDVPSLIVQPALRADQVSISADLLAVYGDQNSEGLSEEERTRLFESYRNGLMESLEGNGAFENAAQINPRRTGTEQTVDPLDPGLTPAERERLQAFCREYPDQCVEPEIEIEAPDLPQAGGFGETVASFFIGDTSTSVVSLVVKPEELKIFKVNLAPIMDWLRQVTEPSEALQACSVARGEFNRIVEKHKPVFEKLDTSWTKISGAVNAAKAFDEACLSGPDELPDYVTERLAVIKLGNDPLPHCTAFQISPSHFLTAKHCFHNQETGQPAWETLDGSLLYRFAEPGTAIEIEPVRKSQIPKTSAGVELRSFRDFIVLKSKTAIGSSTPPELPPAIIGNEVLIPGYFHFARTTNRGLTQSSWRDSIRSTKSIGGGYCRIFDVSARGGTGCLVHLCQAIPGFSGSPVLQSSAPNTYSVVGVNVRADGNRRYNCPTPFLIGDDRPIVDHGNLAALVSETLIDRD